MNEQITDRGTQKRFHTKFHTMNIMRSGTRLIKQSISRACRNHAFGIHDRLFDRIALISIIIVFASVFGDWFYGGKIICIERIKLQR